MGIGATMKDRTAKWLEITLSYEFLLPNLGSMRVCVRLTGNFRNFEVTQVLREKCIQNGREVVLHDQKHSRCSHHGSGNL